MKVCTFEPPLGCQACPLAKLSTSSFLFDRVLLLIQLENSRLRRLMTDLLLEKIKLEESAQSYKAALA